MADNQDKMRQLLGITTSKEEMSKSPKEAVLYILRPETQYTCDKCIYYKDGDPPRCALLGPTEGIKAYGSCGLWVHGDAAKLNIPWIGLVTKLEVGYAENPQGFSCKRCEYFDAQARACQKVRRDSPGDTPGEIHPNACCNRWEADNKKASMTTEQLMKTIKLTK